MFFKKMLLITITVCLTMIPVSVHGRAVSDESRFNPRDENKGISIDDMMASVGCRREYLNVNGWAKLEEDYRSVSDLELIAERASKFFGIGDDRDHISSEGGGIIQVNIRGVNEKNQVVSIICHSVETSEGKNKRWESYIVIDVVDRIYKADKSDAKKQMEAFFNILEADADIRTTLVGSFKGRLSHKAMEDVCDELLNRIHANRVEGIKDEEYISISGYSPLLDENIISGGKPVNVQVAMRYNSYKDKTYLWIGVPVISIEY